MFAQTNCIFSEPKTVVLNRWSADHKWSFAIFQVILRDTVISLGKVFDKRSQIVCKIPNFQLSEKTFLSKNENSTNDGEVFFRTYFCVIFFLLRLSAKIPHFVIKISHIFENNTILLGNFLFSSWYCLGRITILPKMAFGSNTFLKITFYHIFT